MENMIRSDNFSHIVSYKLCLKCLNFGVSLLTIVNKVLEIFNIISLQPLKFIQCIFPYEYLIKLLFTGKFQSTIVPNLYVFYSHTVIQILYNSVSAFL